MTRFITYVVLVFLFGWSAVAISDEKKEVLFILEDHVLVDRIWDVERQRFIEKDTVIERIMRHTYILLGESHDNPIHHEHQGWVIDELVKGGRRPGVSFEMIDDTQEAKIGGKHRLSVDEVFDSLEWEKSGWPNRSIYAPVFTAAVNAQLRLIAGSISKQALRDIVMNGESRMPEYVKADLDRYPLSEKDRRAMYDEIKESHCDLLPAKHVPRLILGQRVRDAVMSRSMVRHRGSDGVVLVAGSGHTRNDRGVPAHLRAQETEPLTATITWHEVREEFDAPDDYASIWDEALPFDYVWFTPRVDRPDPCEEMREFQERQKNG